MVNVGDLRNNSWGGNLTGTVFDDEAAKSIKDPNARAPYNENYRPVQPLGAMDLKNASGTWKLEVYDGVKRNTGKLNSWTLAAVHETTQGLRAGALADAALAASPLAADSRTQLALTAVSQYEDELPGKRRGRAATTLSQEHAVDLALGGFDFNSAYPDDALAAELVMGRNR